MKNSEKKLIDRLYNMILDNIFKINHQIFFNPTQEQEEKFWCRHCDGFHSSDKCHARKKK